MGYLNFYITSHFEGYLICIRLLEQVIVKYPRYRSTWPIEVQEVKASRFLDTRYMKG
jgi:hypothetical protein